MRVGRIIIIAAVVAIAVYASHTKIVKSKVDLVATTLERELTAHNMHMILRRASTARKTEKAAAMKDLPAFTRTAVRLTNDKDPYKDVWGREYKTQVLSQVVTLQSAGPDGIFGTKDDISTTTVLRSR